MILYEPLLLIAHGECSAEQKVSNHLSVMYPLVSFDTSVFAKAAPNTQDERDILHFILPNS